MNGIVFPPLLPAGCNEFVQMTDVNEHRSLIALMDPSASHQGATFSRGLLQKSYDVPATE
jgi:hypothetical protein